MVAGRVSASDDLLDAAERLMSGRGYAGTPVDAARLADPAVPLDEALTAR